MGPLLPIAAVFGTLGLIAVAAKPAKRQGYAPPLPAPAPLPPRPIAPPVPTPERPSELIDPWAAQPAPLPPPPSPAPIAPTPARPVVPSPGPTVAVPNEPTRDPGVLADVDSMLTSPNPPPPLPVVPKVPTPAPVAAPPVPAPISAPTNTTTQPPPSPVPEPHAAQPVAQPTPAPVPGPYAKPVPQPTPQEQTQTQNETPSTGFNPVAARSQAVRVAANLRKGVSLYSHPTLQAWQRLAGIGADGLYGGQSAGALAWYLQGESTKAPRPYFKPAEIKPYRWAALAEERLAIVRAALANS